MGSSIALHVVCKPGLCGNFCTVLHACHHALACLACMTIFAGMDETHAHNGGFSLSWILLRCFAVLVQRVQELVMVLRSLSWVCSMHSMHAAAKARSLLYQTVETATSFTDTCIRHMHAHAANGDYLLNHETTRPFSLNRYHCCNVPHHGGSSASQTFGHSWPTKNCERLS